VDVVVVRSGIKFLRKLNNCWVMGPKTVTYFVNKDLTLILCWTLIQHPS
jgi:hypothetical protein